MSTVKLSKTKNVHSKIWSKIKSVHGKIVQNKLSQTPCLKIKNRTNLHIK